MTIATASGNVYEDDIDHALDRPMAVHQEGEQVAGSGIPGLPPVGHDAPPIVPEQSPNLEILRQIRQLPIRKPGPDKPGEKLGQNDDFYLIRHGSTALKPA